MNISYYSYYCTLLVLIGFWFYCIRSIAAAFPLFKAIPRQYYYGLAGLLALGIFIIQPFIPHTIIFPNMHGAQTINLFNKMNMLTYRPTFSYTYGNTFSLALGALHLLFGKYISIFTLNYMISMASVVICFFFIYLLFSSADLALVTSTLLLFLPDRLRIAATESMFVSVEFYLWLTLFLFLIYFKNKKTPFAILGLCSAYLLLESRIEMIVIAPLFILLFILLFGSRHIKTMLRDKYILGSGVLLGALFVPRILEILQALQTNKMYGVVLHNYPWSYYLRYGSINVFFDPAYTPILLILLFMIGSIAMFFRNRKEFFFFTGVWLLLTFICSKYYITLACYLRRITPAFIAFTVFAGYGVIWLATMIGKKNKKKKAIVISMILALVLINFFLYKDFLVRRYTMQQEFSFLQLAARNIPNNSIVVCLMEADDNYDPSKGGMTRMYQKQYLEDYWRGIEAISIKEFMTSRNIDLNERPVYFYKGAPCYKKPFYRGCPPITLEPGYVNPLCKQLERRYVLETIITANITKVDCSLSDDMLQGNNRTLGLYQILGKKY